MAEPEEKSLWELICDHDPNGIVVVNGDLNVRVANPAFCRMLQTTPAEVVGKPIASLLGAADAADFRQVWETGEVIVGKEREHLARDLCVRMGIFPIASQGVVVAVLVDLTGEWRQRRELLKLRRETVAKAHEVVQNQMRVAQEIAGLLGETAAETKVSLLRLIETLGEESDGLG